MNPSEDSHNEPSTVSELVLREFDEEQKVKINPSDLTIVTLVSPNSGAQPGTNFEPPPRASDPDDFTYGD